MFGWHLKGGLNDALVCPSHLAYHAPLIMVCHLGRQGQYCLSRIFHLIQKKVYTVSLGLGV
jgi:hypothetical protein